MGATARPNRSPPPLGMTLRTAGCAPAGVVSTTRPSRAVGGDDVPVGRNGQAQRVVERAAVGDGHAAARPAWSCASWRPARPRSGWRWSRRRRARRHAPGRPRWGRRRARWDRCARRSPWRSPRLDMTLQASRRRSRESSRTTEPLSTTCPWAATVPLSTLVTNSVALAARVHGRHVPRPVDHGPGDRAGGVPVGVEHDERARPRMRSHSRRGREAADDDVARRRTTASAVVSPTAGMPLIRGTTANTLLVAGRGDLDDARPGALLVGSVVEVGDEDVAAHELADGARHDYNPIGIDVALGRPGGGHGAGDPGEGVERSEERAGGGECPSRGGDGDRQRACSGRPRISEDAPEPLSLIAGRRGQRPSWRSGLR